MTGVWSEIPANSQQVRYEVKTEPTGRMVSVVIDASNQYGNSVTNYAAGRNYPWDGTRRTPFSHTIYYQPGIIVATRMEVTMEGEPGDIIGIKVYKNGAEQRIGERVGTIQPGQKRVNLSAIFTAGE